MIVDDAGMQPKESVVLWKAATNARNARAPRGREQKSHCQRRPVRRNRSRTGRVTIDAAGTCGDGELLDALGDFLADVDEDATRGATQRHCRLGTTQTQIVDGERGAGGLRGGQRRGGLAKPKRDEGQCECDGSRNNAAHVKLLLCLTRTRMERWIGFGLCLTEMFPAHASLVLRAGHVLHLQLRLTAHISARGSS